MGGLLALRRFVGFSLGFQEFGGAVMEVADSRALGRSVSPSEPVEVEGFSRFGLVPLEGVFNCRDLGGLPANCGHRIRRRRLIRSASLGGATAEDIGQLALMHDLECVVDLRAECEVEREPDPLPLMAGIEYVSLPVLSDRAIGISGLKGISADIRALRAFDDAPYDVVENVYLRCLLGGLGMRAYGQLLNGLLAASSQRGATLWHCTQGKDRTGVAAILVEWALGVPMDAIKRDYLASNLFIRPWVERMRSLLSGNRVLGGIAIDLEAYSYSSERYFDRVFEVVERRYGTMGYYMDAVLDFDESKRARLRELYLE